jgi:molecular chaperone GrpE
MSDPGVGRDDEVVEAELLGDPVAADVMTDDDDLAAEALEITAEDLLSDLEAVAAERDQFLDAYRRAQADFENFRKQMVKRQEDAVDRALTSLVSQLLPVLDAGDAARAHGGEESAAADQIAGLLFELLAKEGLEAIEADPGIPFDPNVHDAVAHEPGGDGDPEIAGVLRSGYIWKGRVIRPAMVTVRG